MNPIAILVGLLCFALPAGSDASIDKGTVNGRTYLNEKLGIRYSVPSPLKIDDPVLQDATGPRPGITVYSCEPEGLYRLLRTRQCVVFFADGLGPRPKEERTNSGYTDFFTKSYVNAGNEVIGEAAIPQKLSAQAFLRRDFHGRDRRVYQAVLVTTHDGFAVVFIFTSTSKTGVDELINKTDFEFTR